MRIFSLVSTLLFSAFFTPTAEAKIVADCGAAKGKVFYAHPDRNKWEDDAITGGRIIVEISPDGSANVIFRDALKRTINVKDDGGTIIVLQQSPDLSEFVVLVAYAAAGVVETYLKTNKGGADVLLWTTTRQGAGSIPPKVSAFVSQCE